MVEPRDIEFEVEGGDRLRGWLFTPTTALKRYPAISISLLQYKLFIRRRASATQGTPPGNDDLKWVANTTTLVYDEREALLVDTFLSDEQTAELAEWIAARKGVSQPSI